MPHLSITEWAAIGVSGYLVSMVWVTAAICRATGMKAPKPSEKRPYLVPRNILPPPGYVLGFFRDRRAAAGAKERVRFGWYGVDGGKGLEVVFEWDGGSTQPALLMSPETWADMNLFSAVLNAMAKLPAASVSPENICLILRGQSFADLTGEKACASREKFLSSLLDLQVPLRFRDSLELLRSASGY